jgi:3-oxoacyl-[acyl-carrier protein] reductase
MSLTGKVILVTGGTKGIGKAIVQRVVADGASVIINYASDSNAADKLVSEIGTDRAIAVKGDASKVSDLEHLVNEGVAKFGKIDVVIPNAGIMPMGDLASITEEVFDTTFSLNVKGPLFLVQVMLNQVVLIGHSLR